MTQALPELIGGFVYPYAGIIDKKWVADASGKFAPSYFADRDALVSAMQFARDMYTEGVIEKDIALAKLETSKEKYLQGQSAAMVFAWSGPAGLRATSAAITMSFTAQAAFWKTTALPKLYPSADGNRYYLWTPNPGPRAISPPRWTTKKMAAICRLFDYLYSEEGSRLVFCGFEGEDYDVKDGKVVMREA